MTFLRKWSQAFLHSS